MLNVRFLETNKYHSKKRAPSLFLFLKVSFKSPPKKLIFQKLGHSGVLCLSVKRCFVKTRRRMLGSDSMIQYNLHCRTNLIREAFKKKEKKVWNFPYREGGLTDKIPYFLKLCLKSISGHSESFW